jgi:hypothetical protein
MSTRTKFVTMLCAPLIAVGAFSADWPQYYGSNRDSTSTEKGLRDYLLFLSIYQTCRRKNLSFLRFLRSGKLDLDVFADGTGH